MYEVLRFSWGHVIAFLVLIFLSYVTFMGVAYWTDGDFAAAGIAMAVVDVVLLFCSLGLQMTKAAGRKFRKMIVVERVCLILCPMVFCGSMIPFVHFWSVHAQDEAIVQQFSAAIEGSKQMFSEYEAYAKGRIGRLERELANERKGSGQGYEQIVRDENVVHALRLQLLSDNYHKLQAEATSWIDQSSTGASTWNVFLLGNLREIEAAIGGWKATLASFSQHIMHDEARLAQTRAQPFDASGSIMANLSNGFDMVRCHFSTTSAPGVPAILLALLLCLGLAMPYLLQDRNPRSTYKLFGERKMRGGASGGSTTGNDGEPAGGGYDSFTM